MLPITISEKQYNGVYREYKGSDFEDVEVFKSAFIANATDKSNEIFAVYTNDLNIQEDTKYLIFGYGDDNCHFCAYTGRVCFVHIVELIDDETYYQNSGAGCIKGKVIGKERYIFNFDFSDIEKGKKTYIDYLKKLGCDFESLYGENNAIYTHNVRLLKNISRYRKRALSEYTEGEINTLKESLIRSIKTTNPQKAVIEEDIKQIDTLNKLCDFIKDKKEQIENTKGALYNRNDNVDIRYPVNMVGMNVSLNLYKDGEFNSALPFYFQYDNYKKATKIIADSFFITIEENESGRIENSMKIVRYKFGKDEKEKELIKKD